VNATEWMRSAVTPSTRITVRAQLASLLIAVGIRLSRRPVTGAAGATLVPARRV
jgi:hypothetical protein